MRILYYPGPYPNGPFIDVGLQELKKKGPKRYPEADQIYKLCGP